MKNFILIVIAVILTSTFALAEKPDLSKISTKPYARYWWFASEIQQEDVRYNLNWLKDNGFGGVELAWVYPLNRFNPEDTTYTPRQEWLSPEWQSIVKYTIKYADSIGLGCDMTFGTLWPFGDTEVTFDQATQKFGEPDWRQEIRLSWQHPKVGYVVDHLNSANYLPYFNRLLDSFPRPETKIPQSYFIDSWEVHTEKLWTENFEEQFSSRFGYDITQYMDDIYNPLNKYYLYDYMSLISDKVLEFYRLFDSELNRNGVLSRGQVSGAPCDLISGYALMDIPEGESMLFEPEFCAIPASAGLLAEKPLVSSETFTCIYGWPRDYLREEQTADLKLVADALFANGINHIIWHGKAHNPQGVDTVNFYATTHLGPTGNLASEIPKFNKYLETVSDYMRRGKTYGKVAVYLPTEDSWVGGIMPKDKQFRWAWGYYEMRYVYFPDELKGYAPIWVNLEFLDKATISAGGQLVIAGTAFDFLYIDARYLDYAVIKRLKQLAEAGAKIVLKQTPRNPSAQKQEYYDELVEAIISSENVNNKIPFDIKPFISGEQIPNYWSRIDGEILYIFFANPLAERLKFPMGYGQSLNNKTENIDISINYNSKIYREKLVFKPYQSLLYKIEKGKLKQIDIKFNPKTPIVKNREEDYEAPWLVK